MAPTALTPGSSGTSTPTSMTTASALTQAGIKHLSSAGLPQLDASRMTVELTRSPRAVPAPDSAEIRAQRTCTDHMVTAAWDVEGGWQAPELKPYGAFSIMPTASVLHYATECFEGLKLYRGFDGRLRLFRVARNCERMRRSAARIALPDFEPAELEKLIVALCARDGPKWLPRDRAGSFLYVRPTFIATDSSLGVQRPKEALLYVILACFPDMSKSLATPAPAAPPALNGAANGTTTTTTTTTSPPAVGLRLLASNEDTCRAWPGGFGFAKVGANYGPSLVAQGEARARGFDQVLWLFGKEGRVTEAGASNFFVVWRSATTGKLELITAPLEERIILEGVTRASVLELARDRLATKTKTTTTTTTATHNGNGVADLEPVEPVERRFTMADIVAAYREGRLVEAFAAGTAFFIAPVSLIHFRGEDIRVPMADGDSGVYARVIKTALMDVMYGREAHEWGVVVEEVSAA